ncbi:MAG TPA: hypothetical protein VFM18_00595 [Methanosarcina sp.]|nr:hypothetical protein [Methanosarcina sp.]
MTVATIREGSVIHSALLDPTRILPMQDWHWNSDYSAVERRILGIAATDSAEGDMTQVIQDGIVNTPQGEVRLSNGSAMEFRSVGYVDTRGVVPAHNPVIANVASTQGGHVTLGTGRTRQFWVDENDDDGDEELVTTSQLDDAIEGLSLRIDEVSDDLSEKLAEELNGKLENFSIKVTDVQAGLRNASDSLGSILTRMSSLENETFVLTNSVNNGMLRHTIEQLVTDVMEMKTFIKSIAHLFVSPYAAIPTENPGNIAFNTPIETVTVTHSYPNRPSATYVTKQRLAPGAV